MNAQALTGNKHSREMLIVYCTVIDSNVSMFDARAMSSMIHP